MPSLFSSLSCLIWEPAPSELEGIVASVKLIWRSWELGGSIPIVRHCNNHVVYGMSVSHLFLRISMWVYFSVF